MNTAGNLDRAVSLDSLMEGEILPNGAIVIGAESFDKHESFVLCLIKPMDGSNDRFAVYSVNERLETSGGKTFEGFHDAFRGFAEATGSDPESFANWN